MCVYVYVHVFTCMYELVCHNIMCIWNLELVLVFYHMWVPGTELWLIIRLGNKHLLPISHLPYYLSLLSNFTIIELEDMVYLFKSDKRDWALTPTGNVGCLTPQSSFLLHCRIAGEERAACLFMTLPFPFPYRWVFPPYHIFLVVWKFPAHRALCWDLK